MTVINTNVASLVAQTNLSRANNALSTSLTRLSTGLQINSGADNPSGLIASQDLQSSIIGVQSGISNSQNANALIATADSALGQVSNLLDSIRGLVSQSANTGALSQAQIAANQLQVDSSLQAIDQIASSTSFGGQNLLNGSLDFITSSAGTVDTAASGTVGTVSTAVAATATVGSQLTFTAKTGGTAENGVKVTVASTSTTGTTGTVTVSYTTAGGAVLTAGSGAKVSDAISAIAASSNYLKTNFTVTTATGSSGNATLSTAVSATTSGGVSKNGVTITAAKAGAAYNGVNVVVKTASNTAGQSVAYTTASNTLTVKILSSKTAKDVSSAINGSSSKVTSLFAATAAGSGTISFGTYSSALTGGSSTAKAQNLVINQANFGTQSQVNVDVNVTKQATQGSLTYSGGTLNSSLVLQVGGSSGYNVFNFASGTTTAQIASAVNAVTDATGVSAATDNSGNLTFTSQAYGSQNFVSVQALSGTFATTDASNNTTNRSTGTDVQATINGVQATGNGLNVSLDTPSLNLNFAVNSALTSGSSFNFAITGGGANFQLGPEVNTNEQARLGIQSISTADLGGADGTLYQLQSGGALSLANNAEGANNVVEEVINQVASLAGRLGAFQSTTLQTNINTLQDTLTNLTSAQSNIQDANFASESANLTRAQILVQSSTSVLSIANHNPENLLNLLK